MTTQGSTMAPPSPRQVIGGRMEGGADSPTYVVVLDGQQETETRDFDLASAAAATKRASQRIAVTLETRAGARPQLLAFEILPDAPAPEKALTRAAAPAAGALAHQAPALPTHLIHDPQELAAQFQAMRQHYNVLSPAIAVSQMAPGFGANLAIVHIDSTLTKRDKYGNGSGPDTYFSKAIHKDESNRSLNKHGLQKISAALGIQWDYNASRRTDDGRQRNYWSWTYVGTVRTHDGQLQPVLGSRELDLRDGSAEALKMSSADQLMQQRSMGNQLCETKAMHRAIRNFVQHSYTVDELRKPFLICRFSFTPDMSDPEIRKLVTERALSGVGALYNPPAGKLLPALQAPPDPDDAGDAPAPAKGDPFTEKPAAPLTIVKVDPVKARPPKTWLRYDVAFSDGLLASTFDAKLQKLIDEAFEKKLPVTRVTSEREGFNDQLDALTIVDGTQPALQEGRY